MEFENLDKLDKVQITKQQTTELTKAKSTDTPSNAFERETPKSNKSTSPGGGIKRQNTIKAIRDLFNQSVSDGPNFSQIKQKRPVKSIELPGAEITAYQPGICTRMRLMDKINWDLIKNSLDPRVNRDQIFKTGEAAGASGSFFFFSHDKRFIVKTVTKEELDVTL